MKIIFTIIFAICFEGSHQSEWTYEDDSHWPGACTTGRRQSPINIISKEAVVDRHRSHIRGPLQMTGYENLTLSALNNGHTLKWTLLGDADRAKPTLSGGPLRSDYTFLQLHLHWFSEHAIDGTKFPLEIHLVHIKAGLPLEEALQQPDGLAVIGVMGEIRTGQASGHNLEQLMVVAPLLVSHSNQTVLMKGIDITRVFSTNPQSYYTYSGSLTTPHCTEAVTWIVMDHPIVIADTQYKALSRVDVGGTFNYRNLQPSNRMVYRSVSSCSAVIVPGLLSVISGAAVLFSCALSTVSSAVVKIICPIINFKKKLLGIDWGKCVM